MSMSAISANEIVVMGGCYNGTDLQDAVVINTKTLSVRVSIDECGHPFSCSSQSVIVKPGTVITLAIDTGHNMHMMLYSQEQRLLGSTSNFGNGQK